jgi:shikimate dehydrogenase
MNAADELQIVDGATRLYGIIGDPIVQVKSPEVMTARFRAARRNAILVPLHVPQDRFEPCLAGLKALANLDGLIVTVPYKSRVLSFVDRVLPTGVQVGAVNALRRDADGKWSGDMFDGRGLVLGMRKEGYEVKGRTVMQLGAGGAGSAVAVAFAEAGCRALTLYDIDAGKAADLAKRVAKAYPACKVTIGAPRLDGCDTLVNATPVGMAPGDGLPADLGPIDPRVLVVDIIMKPPLTSLLRHAQACGCRTLGGRHMLEGQAEEVAKFFGIGG